VTDIVLSSDVTPKTSVKICFTLSEAKTENTGRVRNGLYVGTDFGPASLTQSGYPRLVKEWKRRTPPAEAPLVFEGRPEDVAVSGYRTQTPGYKRDFIHRGVTFWTNELFLRRDGRLIRIEKPADAEAFAYRDLLFI